MNEYGLKIHRMVSAEGKWLSDCSFRSVSSALLLGVVLSLSSADAASRKVAVVTTKDPFQSSILPANAGGEINSALAPEDLNARALELGNTFYEIDGPAPYASEPKIPTTPSSSSESSVPTLLEKGKMNWTVVAASAAGLLGLGTLGYFVLSDDEAQTPQRRIRTITDK